MTTKVALVAGITGLGACRTWDVDSEKRPTLPKFDRLLDRAHLHEMVKSPCYQAYGCHE